MKVISPLRTMGQFVFTCLMLMWVFSASQVNAALSSKSPNFKIERTVNLEATVSCGKGIFQNEQASTCSFAGNEGRKGQFLANPCSCDKNNGPKNRLFF